ncbi:MAG TPA: protein kinase [Candidatus Eisenbacteria bacterium]|nr:protein kinase [Candidatus Eisenbacteria bacterium]
MLSPGSTIGPYRIEREIGRGGMGVIFLAHDTRLGRPAAIKALPEDVAGDPDRLQRFEREAKALASLTHPNVAGIYGLEESGGHRYLALEYVEGESLAERLARGPLSVAETIDVALQIAAGIEAAHEAGIIHRDLKPGNVVITPADQAKVLDFGLAKGKVAEGPSAASPTAGAANSPTIAHSPTLLHSPTLQTPATMPGVILGTAAYLSPEQARGKAVDRRTDIWSFGCLVYECLTGRLAFEGETVSDTIAKILERETNFDALPSATPAALRALLARCLEKDPRRRLRDIGDARLTLEELKAGRSAAALAAIGAAHSAAAGGAGLDPAAAKAAAAAGKRRSRLVAAGAFAAGAVIAVAAWSLLGPGAGSSTGSASSVARLSVAVPEHLRLQGITVSGDGATVVARAVLRDPPAGESPVSMLYLRPIDGEKFEPLRGTERAQGFWLHPEGKWIEYLIPVSERSSRQKRMRAPLDGSAPATELGLWDESWTGAPELLESGDQLVSTSSGREYVRIPRDGGTPSEPTPFAPLAPGARVEFSGSLPGDRGVLLGIASYEGTVYSLSVGVLDLKSGKTKVLVRDAGSPRYSRTGHLLFTRRDALFAVPFDLGSLEVKGQPAVIMDGLRIPAAWANAGFSYSRNGILSFAAGGFVGKDRRLVLVGSDGRTEEWSGERLPFEVGAWASPDGARAASVVANATAIYEIWISERGGASSRRVIAHDGVDCSFPVWSPDGSMLAYYRTSQTEEDGVYVVRADGAGPPRKVAAAAKGVTLVPTTWTRDGSRLLMTRAEGGKLGLVSASVSVSGTAPAEPEWVLPQGTGSVGMARLSPDNQYIAYFSDEGGPGQIFVRGWNGQGVTGEAVALGRVSETSGLWSRDSRRIRFFDLGGSLVECVLTPGARLTASSPRTLWNISDLRILQPQIVSVHPDDRILAIRRGEAEDELTRLDVVVGFPALLEERLRRAASR